MNILIVGCGKLGSRLAYEFYYYGHNVSIVDMQEDSFNKLSDEFDGLTITGTAMDISVLKSAGVEGCDAVAVVTSDDNLNITVSQIVIEFFKINNVIARVTDPARETAFNHFGLRTVCPTKISCGAIISAITTGDQERQLSFGISTLGFTLREVEPIIIGRDLGHVPVKPDEIIIGVMNEDKNVTLNTPKNNIVLNSKDKIIYARIND